VKYLLDTHAVVWLFEGSAKLGSKAKRALSGLTGEDIAISDITLLELALLSKRNVIALQPDAKRWLAAVALDLTVLPINAAIADAATSLDLPQGDPFDRVIVATAKSYDLLLITKDRDITASKLVATLW